MLISYEFDTDNRLPGTPVGVVLDIRERPEKQQDTKEYWQLIDPELRYILAQRWTVYDE